MSSFYGNIKNSNRISLIFDKIYKNRAEMEANCPSDGVFNNRYVLIDYGQKKTFPFTRVFPTESEYNEGVAEGKYWKVAFVGPNNRDYSELGYDPTITKPYTATDLYNIEQNQYFIRRDSLLDSKTLNTNPYVGIGSGFSINHLKNEYVTNKEIDLMQYHDSFHHTVWQKIWTQTGDTDTVVEKYICVANLDSEAPILNLIVDAPTDNDIPGIKYIETDKNTDGYITQDTFSIYSKTLNLCVKDGQNFVPAGNNTPYDIETKYYVMEKASFDNNLDKYEQIVNSGIVQRYVPFQSPNAIYKIQSNVYNNTTTNPGSTYKLLSENDGTYIRENSPQLQPGTYYTFNQYSPNVITEANKNALYITEDGGNIFKAYTPLIYNNKLVPSDYNFFNGFITEEKYNTFDKEMYYYNENNLESVYTELKTNQSINNAIAANNKIYWENLPNSFTLVQINSINDIVAGHKYYLKAPYDGTRRYCYKVEIGAGPHFDLVNSTDLEYLFHVPRAWKFAEQIAFNWNPEGFAPYTSAVTKYRQFNRAELLVDDNTTTSYPVHMENCPEAAEYEVSTVVTREEDGEPSANTDGQYHIGAIKLKPQPDTKKFDIKLPEIGNVMSDVWDVIYPRGTMTKVNTYPNKEFDSNYQTNLWLTEDGYAKFYKRVQGSPGIISYAKYLAEQENLYIKLRENEYVKAFEYSPYREYYILGNNAYNLIASDIKLYVPVYYGNVPNNVDLYTFEKNPDGKVRVVFLGNDRANDNNSEYPQTAGEAIRYINYLLGLTEDNDTIENPPRGTVYGLLNGAKTLYGDPADQITGTYTLTTVTSGTFNSKKDSLWTYDPTNTTWSRLPANATFNPNTEYYLINQPGYQPVPTDLSNREDGFISENLFNYLRETGKWPLYTYNESDGSFSPLNANHTYSATTQYYSNLTTLWAYLNDLQDKYPLYQCDWRNNNSNSLGYIRNRPKMIYSTSDGYTSAITGGNLHVVEDVWKTAKSVAYP